MINEKKVERYLANNRVNPLFRNSKVEEYAVEGDTGVWTVRYQIAKEQWSCNCKNIRLTSCIHIECCKRMKNGRL